MHFLRRTAILSSRVAKSRLLGLLAVTSGAWPSGPLAVLSNPAIKKKPWIAVFVRFSGVFSYSTGQCPPRRSQRVASYGPWAQKKRRPPSTSFPPRITENEFLKPHFPALFTAVSRPSPLVFHRFPRLSRRIPVSQISCPVTLCIFFLYRRKYERIQLKTGEALLSRRLSSF